MRKAKAGVKNEMIVFVYSKIKTCLFCIQNMIDIRTAEQRVTVTEIPIDFDDTPGIKILLHRLSNV